MQVCLYSRKIVQLNMENYVWQPISGQPLQTALAEINQSYIFLKGNFLSFQETLIIDTLLQLFA